MFRHDQDFCKYFVLNNFPGAFQELSAFSEETSKLLHPALHMSSPDLFGVLPGVTLDHYFDASTWRKKPDKFLKNDDIAMIDHMCEVSQ